MTQEWTHKAVFGLTAPLPFGTLYHHHADDKSVGLIWMSLGITAEGLEWFSCICVSNSNAGGVSKTRYGSSNICILTRKES